MQIAGPHNLLRFLGRNAFTVYFLLVCAEQEDITPVSARWILEHMPEATSPNTVTAALRFLCSPEHQFAVRVPGGWRLVSGAKRLLPGQMLQGGGDENLSGSENPSGSENLPESENRALRDSHAVVVDDLESKSVLPTITTTTTLTRRKNRAESENLSGSENHSERESRQRVLHEFGVIGVKAREILELPWASPEYIREHMQYAQGEPWLLNPAGMAIRRIEDHVPVPHRRSDDDDRRRYITGKYAEFVQH